MAWLDENRRGVPPPPGADTGVACACASPSCSPPARGACCYIGRRTPLSGLPGWPPLQPVGGIPERPFELGRARERPMHPLPQRGRGCLCYLVRCFDDGLDCPMKLLARIRDHPGL